MDRLPLELHSIIFRSACTDGGTTGRSLALVSRYMREISEPYQLQSIAIHNVADAQGFVKRLGFASADGASVRQLYFSNWMTSTASIYEDERRSPSKLLPAVRNMKIANEIHRQNNHLIDHFIDILTIISPTLHTLTIDLTSTGRARVTMRFELPGLPALRSLTIRNNSLLRPIYYMPTFVPATSLSSLKYLDVIRSHDHGPVDWHNAFIYDLAPSLPSLTHFRLRCDWVTAKSVAVALIPDSMSGVARKELPHTLERLFLQLDRYRDDIHGNWHWFTGEVEAVRLTDSAEMVTGHRVVFLYQEDADTSIEHLVEKWG